MMRRFCCIDAPICDAVIIGRYCTFVRMREKDDCKRTF